MTSKQSRHDFDRLLARSSLAIEARSGGHQHVTNESVAGVLKRRAAALTLALLDTQVDDIATRELSLDHLSLGRRPEEGFDPWVALDEQKSHEI